MGQLKEWVKQDWVRLGTDGSIKGSCGGSGSYNTGVGGSSLYDLTSGANNTGCGVGTLADVTSGSENSAFGTNAGSAVTEGDYNTFLGRDAGYRQSSSTTNGLTTGDNVTCVGYAAYLQAQLQQTKLR